MKIIEDAISISELKQMAEKGFGNFVKAVVDIERNIMAVDAELHADEESLLLENGSKQSNLWGINIYPENKKQEWIEFDSMINLKPSLGNRTRSIQDQAIKDTITQIVHNIVTP
ncbi:hypothetical protein HZC34_05655 [Candidatus Saganbacteria bacterium]|nr:hypothetical protein [Candidatus Saganbacteria bacterium]